MNTTPAGTPAIPPVSAQVGYYRWMICALLLFAATINYVDRQIISILKTTLTKEFNWTDERIYAGIVFSFQLAYAIGMLAAGRIIDRIGLRLGFAIFIALWSLAAIGHAFAHKLPEFGLPALVIDTKLGFATITLTGAAAGFALMRFLLGLGEAGNFPAAIKTVAEWFPKKERALSTGIFNSGTNIGALVTPIVVPPVALMWGWEWAFIATGALGFIWIFWWWAAYRAPEEHPRLKPAELAYIRSDPPDQITPIKWRNLLPHRQTWAFALGKFLTDPIWWLYLFWIPDFLNRQYGVDLKNIGLPLVVIYLLADVGSIGGGWISSRLMKHGWTVNRARKTAMFICAVCVVPILFAKVASLWVAVVLVGVAAAAHQGWSANLFTLTSDMFPRKAVGSVVGIGGMAGAVGGMFLALIVGEVLQRTGKYDILWIIAASAYLFALLVIHLLAPRLEPANVNGAAGSAGRA
ncbi:MAG: MFS transporter [Opitutus sp.]|nr:MFS transporter [Opitutus sp.]